MSKERGALPENMHRRELITTTRGQHRIENTYATEEEEEEQQQTTKRRRKQAVDICSNTTTQAERKKILIIITSRAKSHSWPPALQLFPLFFFLFFLSGPAVSDRVPLACFSATAIDQGRYALCALSARLVTLLLGPALDSVTHTYTLKHDSSPTARGRQVGSSQV